MIIDTHCHMYKSEYEDAEKIIRECSKKNISIVLNGIDKQSNAEILELSKKYDNVYASLGYDHSVVNEITDEDIKLLEDQIKSNKVVAIGEIGIDYHWVKDNKETQKELFEKMLNLAQKYSLPVIVHSRDAEEEVYEILKKYNLKGSIHCYSGSLDLAKKFIELGYYIGVDGPITYKNNDEYRNMIKEIGIDNILLETDSPYLSPEPKRGEKNTSLNLKYIIKKISEIFNIIEEEVIKKIYNNAKKIYKI